MKDVQRKREAPFQAPAAARLSSPRGNAYDDAHDDSRWNMASDLSTNRQTSQYLLFSSNMVRTSFGVVSFTEQTDDNPSVYSCLAYMNVDEKRGGKVYFSAYFLGKTDANPSVYSGLAYMDVRQRCRHVTSSSYARQCPPPHMNPQSISIYIHVYMHTHTHTHTGQGFCAPNNNELATFCDPLNKLEACSTNVCVFGANMHPPPHMTHANYLPPTTTETYSVPSNSEASSQPSLHTTPNVSDDYGSRSISQLFLSTCGVGDFAGSIQGTSSDSARAHVHFLQETSLRARAHTHTHIGVRAREGGVEIQENRANDFVVVSRKGPFPRARANHRIGEGGRGREEQEGPLRSLLERSESGTGTDNGLGVGEGGGEGGGETGTQKSKDENHSKSPTPSTHTSRQSFKRKMSSGDVQVSSLISLFSSPPTSQFSSPPTAQRSPRPVPRLSEDNSHYGDNTSHQGTPSPSWNMRSTPGCACVLSGCACVLSGLLSGVCDV